MASFIPRQYPPLERSVFDFSAAVEAYERLYHLAIREGDRSLAIFAAFKAFQKLEEEALSRTGVGRTQDDVYLPGAVAIPEWVRRALWDTLEAFVVPALARPPAKRPITFLVSLKRTWAQYKQWFAYYSARSAAQSLSNLTGSKYAEPGEGRTERRGFKWLEGLKARANAWNYEDEVRANLALVEPRDLIPTGHLLRIFKKLEAKT